MKTIKVSEASGMALDYLVAKAEGATDLYYDSVCTWWIKLGSKDRALGNKSWAQSFAPSTDWANGGPIIEREEIGIKRHIPCFAGEQWEAFGSMTAKGAGYTHTLGPTPLVAAMRAYVLSRLGNEVEVHCYE